MCIELQEAIDHLQRLRNHLTEVEAYQLKLIHENYEAFDHELDKRIKEMCSRLST